MTKNHPRHFQLMLALALSLAPSSVFAQGTPPEDAPAARQNTPEETPAAAQDTTQETPAVDAEDAEDAAGLGGGTAPAADASTPLPPVPPVPPAPAASSTSPVGASLQLAAPEVDVARLDAWLSSFGTTAGALRYVSGSLGIAAGGAGVGIGVWWITDDSVSIGSREATVGLGVAFAGVGAMSLGLGIYNLIVPTYPEDNYARFALAREEGLSAREFGRFEGELRAMAELGRFTRMMSVVTGFALGLGGVVALIATAAATLSDEQRTIGYATGGVLAGAGVLVGGLSFIPSPYERAWDAYEAGISPDGETATIAVSPFASERGAGVAVAGSF